MNFKFVEQVCMLMFVLIYVLPCYIQCPNFMVIDLTQLGTKLYPHILTAFPSNILMALSHPFENLGFMKRDNCIKLH